MTKFLTWLKSLFIHPKEESNQMSEPLNDATTVQPVAAAPVTTVTEGSATATPAAEVKSGVQDFEAALAFVESGVAQLGAAAKDELKALAKKYL
ncbi:MAG TPA: hypothetical protein DCM44_13900 [Pantoea sp.]|uniref:hypothetical protein n=1 Tax=Pantoea septica TaxID=472695 RepID=UPI000EEC09CE|nr:hypothetical protein [Pantoea septica]HAK35602.1 hypothetical protein [Pantoea sp.]